MNKKSKNIIAIVVAVAFWAIEAGLLFEYAGAKDNAGATYSGTVNVWLAFCAAAVAAGVFAAFAASVRGVSAWIIPVFGGIPALALLLCVPVISLCGIEMPAFVIKTNMLILAVGAAVFGGVLYSIIASIWRRIKRRV